MPYPGGTRVVAPSTLMAEHLQERRDTLDGYDLSQPVQAALLGIHNGSLLQRLPEWGRLMLIALLAEPSRIIDRRHAASFGPERNGSSRADPNAIADETTQISQVKLGLERALSP